MSLRSTYAATTWGADVDGRRSGAPDTALQDPIRARLMKALGGARGVIDGGLPPLLFALVNAVVGAYATRQLGLAAAIGSAAVTGLGIVVLRRVRKKPL